tara:strand:+ start:1715 stop:2167 length:453 start_codon:yes stop_codon:yes gene_type:complete
MHYLCFKIDKNRFAIPSDKIDRVFPLLVLNEIAQSPSYVAGYFYYQEQFILTIDVLQLVINKQSSNLMSTRIVVVEFKTDNNKSYKIALLVEEAQETLEIADHEWRINPLLPKYGNVGGKIANINNTSIQQVVLNELLSEEVLALIHEHK